MAAKKERGAGRPTLFVPEVRGQIVRVIASGAPFEYACAIAGVSTETVSQWIGIGRAIRDDSDHHRLPAKNDVALREEYVQFVLEVEKARTAQKVASLQSIIRSGSERWRHHKTGMIRLLPPAPMTWLNPETAEISFEKPDNPEIWEKQLSGEAWEYYPGNWQARAWILERTDPDNFAKVVNVNINVKVLKQFVLTVERAGLNPSEALEEYEKMIRFELSESSESSQEISAPRLTAGSG